MCSVLTVISSNPFNQLNSKGLDAVDDATQALVFLTEGPFYGCRQIRVGRFEGVGSGDVIRYVL